MSTSAETKAQSWPGSASQLASGAGTAVSVSPASALASGTLAMGGPYTVFDCDFTTQSAYTFSDGVAKTLTDSAGRSLAFTPKFINTASAAIVNGSGVGLTTGSNGGRSLLQTPFSALGAQAVGATRYRSWLRWKDYTPLGSTVNLFSGMQVDVDGVANSTNGVAAWRNNMSGAAGSWYTTLISQQVNSATVNGYDVIVIEQSGGMFAAYIGLWSSGWPAASALRPLGIAALPASAYGMGSGTATSNTTVSQSTGALEFQFANLADATSRTMYAANFRVDLL